jgi:endoglucanase
MDSTSEFAVWIQCSLTRLTIFCSLDRPAHAWRDPTVMEVIMETYAGANSSLPDSTEDASATTQFSSAFLFHKVGTEVEAQSLPWLFNGNSLDRVAVDGMNLAADVDYSVDDSNITFPAYTLSKWFSEDGTPGSKANLTLYFSSGADVIVSAIQWSPPELSSNSSAATGSSDLSIPITWNNGLLKPAALRGIRSDNVILFDDWTQYLGPLQQGRMTYSNQFTWDDGHIILTAATVQAVRTAGVDTTFTIETYPRVPGNYVNYTLTV